MFTGVQPVEGHTSQIDAPANFYPRPDSVSLASQLAEEKTTEGVGNNFAA
jgi:hypothetical protein